VQVVEFVGNAMKGKDAVRSLLKKNQQLLNDSLKRKVLSYAEEKMQHWYFTKYTII
jgi:hypothetical protein